VRLKVSRAAAEERLVMVINEGYAALQNVKNDHGQKTTDGTYDAAKDVKRYEALMNIWGSNVHDAIHEIFPTELEWNVFLNPPMPGFRTVSAEDGLYGGHLYRWNDLLQQLQRIREVDLNNYTDLPLTRRLYVEDIDSFRKVRDVNPDQVRDRLDGNGILQISEDEIQQGLELILGEVFHKKDWGGEINDLYSSLVQVNGRRVATAFLLKGNGLRKPEMRIADCGKHGDQVQRLFRSSAELFIVQFVGRVGEDVITDIDTNVQLLRKNRHNANYLVIDGLNTARLLAAYDKLPRAAETGA
jgi:hypothetical protein